MGGEATEEALEASRGKRVDDVLKSLQALKNLEVLEENEKLKIKVFELEGRLKGLEAEEIKRKKIFEAWLVKQRIS